jgi:hypothetical protein
MARKKQTRVGIKCGGCGHFMDTETYAGVQPGADTPPEKISYIDHPTLKGASFMCACGHYTVVRDSWHNKVISG